MKLKMLLRIGISCLIMAVAVIALAPLAAQAASSAAVITQQNPIIQTNYTADPAPMVYNGTLYLYADHDEDVTVNNFFTMKDWKVYSTTDMVNWTDHGTQMSLSTFSWAASNAWAGQVVARNNKFYWYVPITKTSGGNAIGVGVSNSPTGPFTDARGTPLIANSEIDPTVFIDDDGQAYLYWGNPNLFYVRLNQDMISYSGSIVQVPLTTAGFGTRSGDPNRPTLFEEAPWLHKRNGLYYMTYAASGIPENIAYSTGPSATGPWTYRGIIMPTQGGSFTNHQGIADFGGNSYFFYHNAALPGGGGFKRSIAVERFTYNTNGTFPTINMTTAGVPGVGNLNPYVTTQAETISWESGIETEVSSEGGMNVANIENGDFIKVKGVNFSSGTASFDVRVASATSGGNIEIRLNDSTAGTLLGTCAVTGTGGWQTWVTRTCTVSNATGIHDLYLMFTGGSGFLFNVNWWKFNASGGGPTLTPTRTPTIGGPTNTPTPTQPTTSGVVTRVRFFPRSTFANRMTGGIFQGSNTGTTSGFVNLVTITTQPTNNAWSELTFSNTTAYRYLRYLSPNSSFGNVAEIEFYNGTTRLTGTGFGTAGAWNNGTTTFDKALDGNTTTFFDAATGNGVYVGIDTGVSGPTATRTNTPTSTSTPGSGPTNTLTRTPTVTPTATAGSGGTCSPVSSTITAPFTYDGAGTFCWQSSNLGAYINSWNANSITLNGVNVTNTYVASGSYPAKIGGYWYVSYNSAVSWSHFEAK